MLRDIPEDCHTVREAARLHQDPQMAHSEHTPTGLYQCLVRERGYSYSLLRHRCGQSWRELRRCTALLIICGRAGRRERFTVTCSHSVGILSSKCVGCIQIAVITWKTSFMCVTCGEVGSNTVIERLWWTVGTVRGLDLNVELSILVDTCVIVCIYLRCMSPPPPQKKI